MKLEGYRTPAIVAVAVLLVAGVAGAVIVGTGDSDPAVDVSGDATESSTTVADSGVGAPATGQEPGGSETTVTSVPGGTDAPGSPTMAAPGQQGAALGEAKEPQAAAPPKAGAYDYRVVTDSGDESTMTTTIEDVSEEQGRVTKRVKSSRPNFDMESLVVFEPGRVVVTETTFRVQGNAGRCDWEPDLLQTVLPLKQGATWSSESSCTMTFGATPVTVKAQSSSKVTGLERRLIAGQVLDLWIVESSERYEFGGGVVEATTKNWISPPHGMIVRTEAQGSGAGPQGSGDGSYTSEILNLSPR